MLLFIFVVDISYDTLLILIILTRLCTQLIRIFVCTL